MPTVTVYTAARMKEIEDAAIVSGTVVDGELILTRFDGELVNTGPVNVLKSPNGTIYRLVVDDAGALSTVPV